jgi:hypothetical protein
MDITAIAANGLIQAVTGFQKAAERLSNTKDPVDAVSLSGAAITLSQQHSAYSLAVKTLKIADEIEASTLEIVG